MTKPQLFQYLPKQSVVLFFLALMVRIFYVLETMDAPFFDVLVSDSATYHDLAVGLMNGKADWRFFFQGVFYPLFLYGVYSLFGTSALVVKLIQAVIGATTVVLTERLGTRIGNNRIGIISGGMTCLYGPLVFFEGELLATTFAAFFLVALLLLLHRLVENLSFRRALLFGVVSGASVLTRALFLPIVLLSVVWLLLNIKKTKIQMLKPCLLGLGIGFAVMIAPVIYANRSATGHSSFLPSSGGVNLYIGNNPHLCDTLTIRPGKRWAALVNEPIKHGYRLGADKEKYFNQKVLEYVFSSPAEFFIGLFHKAVRFMNSREIPRNVDVYLYRKWSVFLSLTVHKWGNLGVPFGLLIPFVMLGVVFPKRRLWTPMYIFLVVYPISVVLVFVSSRYRVPMVPLLSVPAAMGIVSFFQAISKKVWKPVVEMSIVGSITLAGAIVPPPFCEEKVDLEGELYHMGGMFLVEKKDRKRAVLYLEHAVAATPENAAANRLLGIVLNESGDLKRALAVLTRAHRLEPTNMYTLTYLGKTLGQLHRFKEGEAMLRKVLKMRPEDGYASLYLGLCLANQGQLTEAVVHLKTAVDQLPKNRLAINTYRSIFKRIKEK